MRAAPLNWGMEWIAALLKAKRRSQADLAKHLGIAPPRVSEMVRGERRLQQSEYQATADFFEISLPRVVALAAGRPDPGEEDQLPAGNVNPAFDAPAFPLLGEMKADVPLYGTAMGGDGNGEFEMNGTMIGAVYRLPGIEGRRDVFALHVVGASMDPWRKANGLIYVEEKRAPSIGDHVVVEFKPVPHSEVRQAVVKQLIGVTPTKLRLKQYNPAKEFEIERKKVHRIYRVIEWDELLKGNR